MGKGGPLAFLNKKPWHPGSFRNQEEIWKREQAYLKEVEKQEALKKHLEEEREKEGFDNFVAEATKNQKEERVEWMYVGGFAAREDAEQRKEEYLLGKAVDTLPDGGKQEPQARVDAISNAEPSSSGLDFSANETWNRLNGDPLLVIKRMEADKAKGMINNAQLRAQLKARLKPAKAKKSKKDKQKRDKHKKRKKHSSTPDASLSPMPHPPAGGVAGTSGRARSPLTGQPRLREISDRRKPSPEVHRRDRSDGSRRQHSDRGASPGRGAARRQKNGEHAHRDLYEGNRHSRHDPHDEDAEHSHRRHSSHGPPQHEDAARQAGDGARGGDRSHVTGGRGPFRRRSRSRDPDERTTAPSRAGEDSVRPGFGLQGGHIPEHARSRGSVAELTREAQAERAAKREREKDEERRRAAEACRKYRPGKKSKSQMAEERTAMMSSAGQLEEQRRALLRKESLADAKEAATHARMSNPDTEEFAMTAETRMLAASDVGTLQGQIRRNCGHLCS